MAGGDVGYTRHDAGNSRAFEQVLGALEGGHAVLFASGMAAITAVLDVLAPASVARPPVFYPGPGRSSTLGRISGRWCANRTPGSTRTPPCAGSSPRRTPICGSSTSLLRVHVIPDRRRQHVRDPYRTATSGSRRRRCGPLGVQVPLGPPDLILGAAVCRDPGSRRDCETTGVDRRHRRAHGGVAGAAGMRTLDALSPGSRQRTRPGRTTQWTCRRADGDLAGLATIRTTRSRHVRWT